MAKEIDRVNFRVRGPKGLYKALNEAAEKNERTFNSEVIYRLAQTFGEEGKSFVNIDEEVESRIKQVLTEIAARGKRQKGAA